MSYSPKNPNGQATMANSEPVVIASDQSSVPIAMLDETTTTGSIVANGDTVVVPVEIGMAGLAMGYYGTYATGASLAIEASFDGGSTYSAVRMIQGASGTLGYVITIAAVSNSTSYFVADVPAGATHLRVRCTAWAAPTGAISIVLTQTAQRFGTPNGAISLTAGTLTTLTNITNWGNIVDNAAFTDGTTRLMPGGYIFDEVAGTALTENDAAAARIDSKRAQIGVIEDATTRGQRLAVSAAGAAKVDLTAGTNTNEMVGDVAEDAALAGNPVRIGMRASAAEPSSMSTDNDVITPWGDLKGRQVVTQKAATGTQTSVASSASNVTLLAASTSRLGATLYNDSTQVCYVRLAATATSSNFTVKMQPDAYYEVPFGYTGIIDGIWASANGNMRVTQIT